MKNAEHAMIFDHFLRVLVRMYLLNSKIHFAQCWKNFLGCSRVPLFSRVTVR